MNYIIEFLNDFIKLSNEMSPYLLLGFIIAGILHVYIKKDTIAQYLGANNFKSVIYAALLGIPLPLCSCGVIPTGISFYKNGASKGASVSFLISTPQTGVDSIMVTYSLLGLPLAILRPIIALLSGLMGGLLTNITDRKHIKQPTPPPSNVSLSLNLNKLQKRETSETCSNTSCGCYDNNPKKSKFRQFATYAFVDFMQDIAVWLIIGLGIAALLSVLLPDDFFQLYIGNKFVSMLIVIAASVPLYVCATGSVPIAAMLIAKGLSPGAAIAFLMAGPATNAATITIIGKSMGRNALLTYLASIIGGAIIFGVLIDLFIPVQMLIPNVMLHNHNHEVLPAWIHYASTIIMAILATNAILLKYKVYTFNTKKQHANTIKISVYGMTCNHCKMNVEKNLMKLTGIKTAVVDLASKTVTINGNTPIETIKKTINSLGYEFRGTAK